ncbi:hypothetical protein H2200_000075 [Cladophialophora chaetospira]|uniref:Uncharacterized protein n=1 Tax=Cladophialophora chaetospira TaxID=386627 RepID=A0AA38XMV2_9EURO|nr:hypothetical protein H2200_000075 [Cladophialophora chaetospira]
MSSTKRPSIFSRLSSSASSLRSNSTSSSTPKSCRDYNRYAKDGKGYDFNLTYPYSTSSSSASSTKSSTASEMPLGARDFKLRYAKDGKGHDFATSYATNYAMSLGAGNMGEVYIVSSVPRGSRHLANKNMRYAWHQGRQASS